jgi:hypothetical protein
MRSLWETMLWRWLGQRRMAVPDENTDLSGWLQADASGIAVAFVVRRAAVETDRAARPPETSGHADYAAAIDRILAEGAPDPE